MGQHCCWSRKWEEMDDRYHCTHGDNYRKDLYAAWNEGHAGPLAPLNCSQNKPAGHSTGEIWQSFTE